ncbi:CBS domain-containing protein [Streptomyces sp. ICBB 8177]|uniref:CBS domain-containing protein n=1 Tax=Streptomyces sp. ICBB 8177 TaxID=563922 RepID=UPI000D67F895|nr:CBS domain-containing protein [Streptomyces sp. ICBB 8177]PWI44720.1 hypothetical protein CK485_05715 [Streptomyces sp. ICBB 8177]
MTSTSPFTVRDVMSRKVVAVRRAASFKEIVGVVATWRIGALPVLDDDNRVVGVVSETDLLPKEEFRAAEPSRTEQMLRLVDLGKAGALTAEDAMTCPAVTVRADATLAQAARAMAQAGVKQLPVVDDRGRLTGLVSRGDLLRVFLRPDTEIAKDVRDVVTEGLFAAVTPPVRVTVAHGVVTLSGAIPDTSLVPIAARLARAVEGVVDVQCELRQAHRPGAQRPLEGPARELHRPGAERCDAPDSPPRLRGLGRPGA